MAFKTWLAYNISVFSWIEKVSKFSFGYIKFNLRASICYKYFKVDSIDVHFRKLA